MIIPRLLFLPLFNARGSKISIINTLSKILLKFILGSSSLLISDKVTLLETICQGLMHELICNRRLVCPNSVNKIAWLNFCPK